MGESSSKTTHTPGPWTSSRGRRGFRHLIHGKDWSEFAKVVTRLLHDDEERPEGLANVRLICAAPDLLAACKEALRVLAIAQVIIDRDPGAQECLDRLAKAIAKAEAQS